MIYELIGRLTVKVLRFWLSRKTPVSGTVLAAAAATGVVAVVAAVLIASGEDSPEEV